MTVQTLTLADLIPDEPLSRTSGGRIPADMDTLNHSATARRVAELVAASKGHLNVALFGPWGSGKSSFYGLVGDQLESIDVNVKTILFDAWKNSGPGFQTNFLSAVASQVEGADKDISSRLFKTTSSVNLPFGASITTRAGRRKWWIFVAALFVTLFIVAPVAWTGLLNLLDSEVQFWQLLAANLGGWAGFAASGSVLFVIVSLFLDLSRVTVQESTPSHISQFSRLFNELMSKSGSTKYVIFIDELDRCRPEDVMTTLEGLRTFLGHEQCVFVVAFDREAIAMTIGRNMPNEVPSRPQRPYYSTSGEYLDKIFQFQISLPPQPVHTFRRFAAALVKDKAGVWGQLRDEDPRRLDRVIRILSPMHVTSPRRTKVLLNDFAMNARIFESSGFDWIVRAEEIAALTVLQTEFPVFASDLELEPGLLKFVAEQIEPVRESLADLYIQYSRDGTVELDELVESTEKAAGPARGSAEQDDGQERKVVAHKLNDNLHRFLRRLHDMGCQLPMADLILMHSDGNLLSFNDLATYNALLGATDIPRAETLETLVAATPNDRALALLYLLEHVEGASPDEAEDFVILAGAVANTLENAIVAAESDALTSAWEQLVDEVGTPVARFDTASLSGYAKALVVTYSANKLDNFYNLILERNPSAASNVFATVLTETSPAKLRNLMPYLSKHAADSVRDTPESLRKLLVLQDSSRDLVPDSELAAKLSAAFIVDEPLEVEAASTTNAAIAAAAEENAEALAIFTAELEAASSEWSEFLQVADELSVEGAVKPWLLQVARSIGTSHPWALDAHDHAIQRDIARGLTSTANEELLAAIREQPQLAKTRWTPLLVQDTDVLAENLSSSLLSLIGSLGAQTFDLRTREEISSAAVTVSGLSADESVESDALLDGVASLFEVEWTASDANGEFKVMTNLLDVLIAIRADESRIASLRSQLVLKGADSEADGVNLDDLSRVTNSITSSETDHLQTALMERAREAEPAPALTYTRRLFLVQKRAFAIGTDVRSLAFDIFTKSFGDPGGAKMTDVGDWIETVPSRADLLANIDSNLLKVDPKHWTIYAGRTNEADRTALWARLQAAGAPIGSLKAVATGGVTAQLYADAADRVIAAKTNAPKTSAVAEFRTLPAPNRSSAKESVRIATHLASSGAGLKTDVTFVVQLLLENAQHVTSAERTAFKKYLGPWLDAGSAHARKRDLASLRDLGFAPAVPSAKKALRKLLGGRS
jgi:hypothetical protein